MWDEPRTIAKCLYIVYNTHLMFILADSCMVALLSSSAVRAEGPADGQPIIRASGVFPH